MSYKTEQIVALNKYCTFFLSWCLDLGAIKGLDFGKEHDRKAEYRFISSYVFQCQ
jgi:hypothetical protein